MPVGQGPGWWDRGLVLVNLAVAVVLGATGMSDIALLAHQRQVFGDPPSDTTVGRALAGLDESLLRRVASVRARVRAHVWHLLALRPGGFPWLVVAGKLLTGWVVIDIDATLITVLAWKGRPAPAAAVRPRSPLGSGNGSVQPTAVGRSG